MGVRRTIGVAAAVAMGLALAACSSSSTKTYFETEGLRAPDQSCPVKPSRHRHRREVRRHRRGQWLRRARCLAHQHAGLDVRFSQPATMNCGMAEPLSDWLEKTVQPEARRTFGESVVAIDVAASYSCRPRNNKRGAKMSEHGLWQRHRHCRLHARKRAQGDGARRLAGQPRRAPLP